MKRFLGKMGQIGIIPVLTIAGSVIVAIIGGYFSQSSRMDTKLEVSKQEQQTNQLAIVQRITANETKTDALQNDVREIKADVKLLLKLLK